MKGDRAISIVAHVEKIEPRGDGWSTVVVRSDDPEVLVRIIMEDDIAVDRFTTGQEMQVELVALDDP